MYSFKSIKVERAKEHEAYMRPTRRCSTATFPPVGLLSASLPIFALPCYRTTRCPQYRLSTHRRPDFQIDQSSLIMRSEPVRHPGCLLVYDLSSVVSPSDSNIVNADVLSGTNTEQKFTIRLKGMFLLLNHERHLT
jgi:hypothetical protein